MLFAFLTEQSKIKLEKRKTERERVCNKIEEVDARIAEEIDERIAKMGRSKSEDLGWTQTLEAFACFLIVFFYVLD